VARNKLVRLFLESTADELLLIDSDISWYPPDIMRLIARDRPVVGGCAPFRTGTGDFPCRLFSNEQDGLIEARLLPTMMLKIQRNVFTKLIDAGLAPIKKKVWTFDNKGEDDPHEQYHQFFAFEDQGDRIISED
jgi:hypothetical protein